MTVLTHKLNAVIRFLNQSDFWSTLCLWIMIAGVCVVLANVMAAGA